MIPIPSFTVEDTLTTAILRFADSRTSSNGAVGAMNIAMQYWVSFIMGKQTVADKPGIRARLMARAERAKVQSPVRKLTRSRKKEAADSRYLSLRDSVAAAIVWSTNYKGARWMTPEKFFGTVGSYIAARQYSAGHHKAGFRPALNVFKIARGQLGVAPNYPKVSSIALAPHLVTDSILEAEVRNMAAGSALNPTGGSAAVDAAKAEVIRLLTTWTTNNIIERANSLGFISK